MWSKNGTITESLVAAYHILAITDAWRSTQALIIEMRLKRMASCILDSFDEKRIETGRRGYVSNKVSGEE